MATLIWALACQRVLIDQQTNLVSYIDALDGAIISQFPVQAPPILVGTIWQRGDESKLEMRVIVYAPDGSRLMEAEAVPLVFAPQHRRGRMNVGFAGFPIKSPGRFQFGVETKMAGKWTEVTRFPFDVEAASQSADVNRVPAIARQ